MSLIDDLKIRLEFEPRVKIDLSVLDRICGLLISISKTGNYNPYDWRDANHFPGDDEDPTTVSQFFAIGNSINFRYWWLDSRGAYRDCEGNKGKIREREAYYMWRSLRLCMDDGTFPILDAQKLSKAKLPDLRGIFKDDRGRVAMPHLEERLHNLRDLGHKLHEYWGGEFYNLVKAANGSLYQFVQYSRQFRAFDDPLCKLTMVNAIMHKGRGLAKFDRPIFPAMDYELPKQQMRIGILVLDEELEDKITNSKMLTNEEARALRTAGLKAFLLMMDKTSIDGDVVDNIWWNNRKVCLTEGPKCQVCIFRDICKKKIEYGIPLENTRYY